MFENHMGDLMHHLIYSNRTLEAYRLIADKDWLAYRASTHGPEEAIQDTILVIDQAIKEGLDFAVAPCLLRLDALFKRNQWEWETGEFVINLIHTEDAQQIQAMIHSLGDAYLPWSSLIAIGYLISIDLIPAAVTMLDDLLRQGWRYQPMATGHWARHGGLCDEGIVEILARICHVSSSKAAVLVLRFFEGQAPGTTPNRYTIWNEVLMHLIANPEDIGVLCAAVEQIDTTILPGEICDGLSDLYETYLRILTLLGPQVDSLWLGNQFITASGILQYLKNGDREIRWEYRAYAPYLIALSNLAPSSKSLQLEDIIGEIRPKLPIPPIPSAHNYYDRSHIYARYALALSKIGHPDYETALEAALVSCKLDAKSNDPPKGSIQNALGALLDIDNPDLKARVMALATELGMAPQGNDQAQRQYTPNLQSSNHLERGLAIIDAKGGNHPISDQTIRQRYLDQKINESDPKFRLEVRDAVLMSLAGAWPRTGSEKASQMIEKLRTMLSKETISHYKYSVDTVAISTAYEAIRRNHSEEGLRMLREHMEECIRKRNINGAVGCFLAISEANPLESEACFHKIALRNKADQGTAIVLAVKDMMNGSQPNGEVAVQLLAMLPHLSGQICTFEPKLLLYLGGNKLCREYLMPHYDRILAKLESLDIRDLSNSEQDDDQSIEPPTYFYLLTCLAAVDELPADAAVRFDRLLSKLANCPKEGIMNPGTVLEPFERPDCVIRNSRAAKFYQEIANAITSDYQYGRYEDLASAIHLGCSLYPEFLDYAKGIVARTINQARERLAMTDQNTDFMRASAVLIVDLFGQKSCTERTTKEFAAALSRLARTINDRGIADILGELASLATTTEEKGTFFAYAIKSYLETGAPEAALPLIDLLTPAALEQADVLDQLPPDSADENHIRQFRAVISSIIGRILTGSFLEECLLALYKQQALALPRDEAAVYLERNLEAVVSLKGIN